VIVAMTLAGLINLSTLLVAAALFNKTGRTDIDSIQAAHAGLGRLAGGGAVLAFVFALLASGLAPLSPAAPRRACRSRSHDSAELYLRVGAGVELRLGLGLRVTVRPPEDSAPRHVPCSSLAASPAGQPQHQRAGCRRRRCAPSAKGVSSVRASSQPAVG